MRNLVVRAENPVLVAFANSRRKSVIALRAKYARRMAPLVDRLEKLFNVHTDLCREIKRLKNEIQIQTRGIPATEAIDSAQLTSGVHQQAVADKFLLKKAYKLAASMAHPDKGGSHDDFIAINAAYRAGDLKALNEYVISRHKGLFEQIEYWITETQKPEIDWLQFQASDNFKVIQLYMQCKFEASSYLAKGLLEITVLELLYQLNQVVKETYHGTHQESKEGCQGSGEEGSPLAPGEEGSPSAGQGTSEKDQGTSQGTDESPSQGTSEERLPGSQDWWGSNEAPGTQAYRFVQGTD